MEVIKTVVPRIATGRGKKLRERCNEHRPTAATVKPLVGREEASKRVVDQ